jgi:hypothetical protein
MSLRVTTITLSVTVTVPIPMIIAGGAMLATTPRTAAATAATGDRRRCYLGFSLLPVLSKLR